MTQFSVVHDPSRFRVGTLVYSRAGLVTLFARLLWGDFLYTDGKRYRSAGCAESSRLDKLYEAVDKINQQFGKKTVFHLSEGIQP